MCLHRVYAVFPGAHFSRGEKMGLEKLGWGFGKANLCLFGKPGQCKNLPDHLVVIAPPPGPATVEGAGPVRKALMSLWVGGTKPAGTAPIQYSCATAFPTAPMNGRTRPEGGGRPTGTVLNEILVNVPKMISWRVHC